MTPPPDPTCPIQFAAGQLPTYNGTHSGGGIVCLSVTKDFTGVAWFHASERRGRALQRPVARRADDPAGADRRPALRLRQLVLADHRRLPDQPGSARHAAGDAAARRAAALHQPAADVDGDDDRRPAVGRRHAADAAPRRRDGPAPAAPHARAASCAPAAAARHVRRSASATVAGVKLTAAKRTVTPSRSGRTVRLALPARARRALAAALRLRRSVRVRVTVLAARREGNRAKARRTITLRR